MRETLEELRRHIQRCLLHARGGDQRPPQRPGDRLHEVEWRPRRAGRSKVFNVRTVLSNLAELFKLRLTLWREG